MNHKAWLAVGFVAQGVFAGRFIVQWIYSEKKKESVIPIAFWYMSLIGGAMLLTYALYRKDIVIILGQATGVVVYLRNLYFLHRKKTISRD